MAAMVQTYPQQTATVTMLQTRPTSASGIIPGHSQPQPQANQQYMANQQVNRNSFHGLPNVGGQTSYRGTSGGPIQPYAFTATPTLANGGQRQVYGTLRTNSSPNVHSTQMADHNMALRPRYNTSMTNLPSTANIS